MKETIGWIGIGSMGHRMSRHLVAAGYPLVVADAAQIVGERALSELAPELIAAFDVFMDEPEETDKRCRAKIAIVEALKDGAKTMYPEYQLKFKKGSN